MHPARSIATRLLLSLSLTTIVVPLVAQSAPTIPPAYDVVSIKPNKSGSGNVSVSISPEGFTATNMSVESLMQNAYGLKTANQIYGLPAWTKSSTFDIQAKATPDVIEALKKLPREEAFQQRRLMMQGLLADRFQLKLHHETRELPVYALVIAKGGPKLKQSTPGDTYPNGFKGPDGVGHGGSMMVRGGQMDAQGLPISNLADNLSNQLHRQVLDKTGLTGNFDFSLHWAPDDLAADSTSSASETTAPSLFTAVQEQLGLRLDPTKGPVDTVVVDHIELPSEN